MIPVVDWSRRKLEIASAFREAAPLPADAAPEAYQELIQRIGIATPQDMNILISFITDVIMAARREERPTTPLEEFMDWLRYAQAHG